MLLVEDLAETAARDGLRVRGAFHPEPRDAVPDGPGGTAAGTLVLLGLAGQDGWPAFAGSPEARDHCPDPLDRWSRRTVSALASRFDARPLYPFEGPPWHPFGWWAGRAEAVFSSPLGLEIHPHWGLWHSYRGALAFAERLALGAPEPASHPCASCEAKPCLSACPVGAFTLGQYAVSACRAHLDDPAGTGCRSAGCAARRACPVGAEHAYGHQQATFLMRAFRQGPVGSPVRTGAGVFASLRRAEIPRRSRHVPNSGTGRPA